MGLGLRMLGACLFVPLGRSRGGSGAVDTTDTDGPSELGQGLSPCADGHAGWPLTRIHAVGTAEHVGICRERGLRDGQEGGW